MKTPLVSIAMATYNGEKYLKKQLDSIYAQTYKSIEVIVTDDCSTDSTVEILKEYKEKYGLQYFVNEKNIGFVKNFEKAISFCTGDYIALADQDDVWLVTKIQELITHIGDNLLIHSDAYLIDEIGMVFSNSYQRYSKKMVHPTSLVDTVINGYITGCTCMFSKNLIKQITPFPKNLYVHDKWIGCNAFYQKKVVYYDKPLIKYRQHSSNAIGAKDMENIGFLEKMKEYGKQKKYKNTQYYRRINDQLNLAQTIYDKFYINLKGLNKLRFRLLLLYYKSIWEKPIPIKAFFIRLLLFNHFEINKPMKVRVLGLFSMFIRNKGKITHGEK